MYTLERFWSTIDHTPFGPLAISTTSDGPDGAFLLDPDKTFVESIATSPDGAKKPLRFIISVPFAFKSLTGEPSVSFVASCPSCFVKSSSEEYIIVAYTNSPVVWSRSNVLYAVGTKIN